MKFVVNIDLEDDENMIQQLYQPDNYDVLTFTSKVLSLIKKKGIEHDVNVNDISAIKNL